MERQQRIRAAIITAMTASAILAVNETALAAVVGWDDTSAAPYANGWQYGDDGSTGGDAFGSWRLFTSTSNGGFAGHFMEDSTTVSNPGANINAADGKSWGMYGAKGGQAGGTGQADAYRDFNGGALTVGQTFSIKLAVNYRNGYKGIDVRDLSNNGATVFNFNVGGDNYSVNDAATGNGSIGAAYSGDTAFLLSLTQTSLNGGTWQIARSGGVTDLDTGTYIGQPSGFKLYVGQTDGGDPNNLYANSMSIVPEPACMATALAGVAGVGMLRRRRRR